MSSSRAGGGDDDGAEGGGQRARRGVLDTRNVVVNLRALAITSVAVDTCKLALATVTAVRRQPNRGFVFLASIAVWSLSAKLAVTAASLAAYGLVFWAAPREARRPVVIAAAVFAVAIAMRFLFMIEGAVVVLQESTEHTANASWEHDAAHLHHVLTKSELHGPMVHLKHDILDAHSANAYVAPAPPTPKVGDIVLKILQANIIHTCSVAVHVVFLLVIRKYMRCTKVKQRLDDMPAEART